MFNSRLGAVCDEMAAVLQRSAFSINFKDRRDFSWAVCAANGVLSNAKFLYNTEAKYMCVCGRVAARAIWVQRGSTP